MLNRTFVLAASAVAMVVFMTASSTHAAWSPLSRVNHVTFSNAVSLPGVTLAPGVYTFEEGLHGTNPTIVRVTTRDGRRVLYVGFTMMVSRPAGSNVPVVAFGEAPAGQAIPIAAWYPIGSSQGHRFLYR